MSQTTITVPQNVVEAVKFFDRNHVAIIGVLAVALLASIVTEVVKRRYNARQVTKAALEAELFSKKAVAWTLTATTTAFTGLGYALFLLQSNQSVASQLPYIGQGVTEALGVGYLLYNLRLNKTYQRVSESLSKWSNRKTTAPSLPQPAAPQTVAVDELV